MNRIRSIKPEIRRSRKIADCGLLATLLSRDLITYADDQGRFRADVREVKAECLPYFDSLKLPDVEKALQALASRAVGYIELYEVDGERYGWMPGWFRHQRLQTDRFTWSEHPPPPSYEPRQMSKVLQALWDKAAAAGELPARGDGTLVGHIGSASEPLVSNSIPNGFQDGTGPAPHVSSSIPSRARADRRGEEGTGPDRTGPENASGNGAEPASVTPMPLSPEVRGRVEALEEGCLEILAGRRLKAFERDLVLGWASTLRRSGELVPVDEILAVVRRKMAQLTPEGTLPANLKWCADDVQALARAPNGAVGAAGERLTHNSQLARQIEARLRERQGGATS